MVFFQFADHASPRLFGGNGINIRKYNKFFLHIPQSAEHHFDKVKISRFAAGEIYHLNVGNCRLPTLIFRGSFFLFRNKNFAQRRHGSPKFPIIKKRQSAAPNCLPIEVLPYPNTAKRQGRFPKISYSIKKRSNCSAICMPADYRFLNRCARCLYRYASSEFDLRKFPII